MKYFEFGAENPELMVMLHGGGTSYRGMLPTAKEMRFVKKYFPTVQLCSIPKMEHAELVMLHPQEFYRRAMKFFTHAPASQTENS